ELENIDSYILQVSSADGAKEINVDAANASFELKDLEYETSYQVSVTGINEEGRGSFSNPIKIKFSKPEAPSIFNTARRYQTATLFWQSVEGANGYNVYQQDSRGKVSVYDAGNVFGYRVEKLQYDEPYKFWVKAYNGLGESQPSEKVALICKEDLPIPPRNIAAKESQAGVHLKWLVQDTINKNVKYRVYRGASPYNFTPIADGISGDSYVDKKPNANEIFYSVKSYNSSGETNFFTNTATLIRADQLLELNVADITKEGDVYKITVNFKNFPTDGDVYFGAAISNVSYLNVEEQTYFTDKVSDHSYIVSIPARDLRGTDKYAVKALINTNGAPKYSEPPHKNISND
ncbi:MAG: fibronectin type III domain-containing protein, partial [Cyclobacteriaceae bacterium]